MERAPQGEIRTPTSAWAGLNLSKTSPFALETIPDQSVAGPSNSTASTSGTGMNQRWNRTDTSSPYNMSATTGIMDVLPAQQRALICQHKDIHSLMMHLGLEHYISKFHRTV